MASQRLTSTEKRALERAVSDVYSDIRLAAEAHRYMYNVTGTMSLVQCRWYNVAGTMSLVQCICIR